MYIYCLFIIKTARQINLFIYLSLSGSEDCLFLDVYTPNISKTGSNKLPVMVYFHGGSLIQGYSHEAAYFPTLKLAVDQDVMFVSAQYR